MSQGRWVLLLALVLTLAIQIAEVRLLVVAGNSMAPSVRDGDLVITTRFGEDVAVGSVVLVRRPSDGQLLLHRVIERGAGWRRTKGDASLSPDAERIPDDAVLGTLAAVIPAGLFPSLRLDAAAAQFSTNRRIDLGVTSASGARAVLSGPVLAGADALGQLLPGGRATWMFTLTPCPVGLGGECTGSTNTLRIDPVRFTAFATGGLARSIRLTATCRAAGTTTWIDSADLFTAAWSSTNLTTGRLATLSAGAGTSECQVQVTLLGSIAAVNSALTLPLRWGPE
jgi:signal peptidase I